MPYYVYILASASNGTLYVGVTNDLVRRVSEHRTGAAEGYTKKYGDHRLVYYEVGKDIEGAIAREKGLTRWKRDWKRALIERDNSQWDVLYDIICR